MTIFREENKPDGTLGPVSIRRVLAGFFALVGAGAGFSAVFLGASWQVVVAAFSIPLAAVVLLLLFTTWTDLAGAIKVVKDVV